MKTLVNYTHLAGKPAIEKELFGDRCRYAVYAIHTRSDAVEWIVLDAETLDEKTGRPSEIRQASSRSSAMEGLA